MKKETLRYDFGLPNKLSGKTFAQASKAIEAIFKNRMSNIDLRTKEELMSRLKDMQEVKRQEMQQQMPQYQNQMMYGGPNGEQPYPQSKNNEFVDENSKVDAPVMTWAEQGGGAYDKSWLAMKAGQIPGQLKQVGNWAKTNSEDIMGGVGLAASILGPMIANRNAMKSLRMPGKVNAYKMDENQYQPTYVNRQQLLRNADEQAATQRFFMSQAGNTPAQQSAMQGNLNANRLVSTGNLMLQSDMADMQEKQRIQGLKGNVQQFNIGQQQRADEMNEQNMAAYYNTMAAYKQAQGANIGSIGQSLFNLMQAKKYGRAIGNAGVFQGINNGK